MALNNFFSFIGIHYLTFALSHSVHIISQANSSFFTISVMRCTKSFHYFEVIWNAMSKLLAFNQLSIINNKTITEIYAQIVTVIYINFFITNLRSSFDQLLAQICQ